MMECPQCFCIGEHRCTRPYTLPARFHCEVCSGLKNPLACNGSCLWCFEEYVGDEHLENCHRRPLNKNIYDENKCYCPTIGVNIEELLMLYRDLKCVRLNCSMLEWEMYKLKTPNRNLYEKKIIVCTDGLRAE